MLSHTRAIEHQSPEFDQYPMRGRCSPLVQHSYWLKELRLSTIPLCSAPHGGIVRVTVQILDPLLYCYFRSQKQIMYSWDRLRS